MTVRPYAIVAAALLCGCPSSSKPRPKQEAPATRQGEGVFVFEKGRLPRSVPRFLTAAERRPWDRAVAAPKNRGKLHTLFRPAISSAAFIKSAGIRPDDVVADIGCGTGALQIGLLEHRIPFGKMYAVDQQEGALALLNHTLSTTRYPGWKKITTHVPGKTDTRLPDGSLHRVLIVNVMQFIFDRSSGGLAGEQKAILGFLTSLKRALRPDGLVYQYKELGGGPGGAPRRSPAVGQAKHLFARMAYPLETTGYRVLRQETLVVEAVKYLLVVATVPSAPAPAP